MSTEIHVIDGPNGRRIYLGKAFPSIYLTVREAEIAQLMDDFKYREIAKLMKISRRTAEYYASNMKKKLSCETKRQMIYVLKETGILEKLKSVVDITYLFESGDDKNNNGSKPAS